MHEMALAESVLEIIERTLQKQPCNKVTKVRLDIGALSHVEPHALQFCFEAVVKGSRAEGAALEIRRTPGRAWCQDCNGEVQVVTLGVPCPVCGTYRLEVTGGTEMRVCNIKVE